MDNILYYELRAHNKTLRKNKILCDFCFQMMLLNMLKN